MRDVLADICDKLQHGKYRNEEHVRLALVCRVLKELDWNIWDPEEVNTEFRPIPTEDQTRADIALFAQTASPWVFVEAKAVGRLDETSLRDIERQVRDYNRNNTALFSVITDGRKWRFYYSQTGGEFHDKCFRKCDLLEDDLDALEQTFLLFLGKENILNRHAEEQAKEYLQLTNLEKAARDCLPHAERSTRIEPYPTLPQAMVRLLEQRGFRVSENQVRDLLARIRDRPPVIPPPPPPWQTEDRSPLLDPDNPGDMHFTRVGGSIGGIRGRKWRKLVNIGIELAVQRGHTVQTLNACLPINIREGIYTREGYSAIHDLDLSVQGMDANNAVRTLVQLAKKLDCQLELRVSWYGKSPRAGEQGVIRWPS